jgi:hypothetical protein
MRTPALVARCLSRRVAAWRVHPRADHVAQDRPIMTPVDSSVDCSGYGWWQRDEHDLAALATHPQDPVAVLLAQVGDTRAAGLEDP